MVRIALSIVMLIHGLIHLMGFAKAFKLAELSQLQQEISRPVGLLWLIAALLFLVAIPPFLLRKDWWWMIAAMALILSQIVVVVSWSDAKFGTVANLILLVPVVAGFGMWNFGRMVEKELGEFLPSSYSEKRIVTQEMISSLPPVVQTWLHRSHVLGNEITTTAHLTQRGEMRTTNDGKWMPVGAEQWFTTERPGFLWSANVSAAPGVSMPGRDLYQNGRGHMLIKVFGLVAVADARGSDVDQGAMLRYLAEMCWFPSAALREYVQWKQLDSASAEATMSFGGVTASGIFRFNAEGDISGFEAKRYYFREGGSTLEDWSVRIEPDGYREFEGVRVGARCSVSWKLKDGEFTWFRLELTSLKFNEALAR